MSNCAQFKYRSTAGLKCAELHIGLCCYPDVTLVSSFRFSSFITGVWKVLRWLLLLGFVLMAFNTLYLYAPNVKHRLWHPLGAVVRNLDTSHRTDDPTSHTELVGRRLRQNALCINAQLSAGFELTVWK